MVHLSDFYRQQNYFIQNFPPFTTQYQIKFFLKNYAKNLLKSYSTQPIVLKYRPTSSASRKTFPPIECPRRRMFFL